MRFWIVAILLALIVLLFFGCATGCGEGYSEGSRVGVITKFSRKGVSFKSYEGEMNLGGMRAGGQDVGLVANVWAFHASDRLAPQIEAAKNAGLPVTIAYKQWIIAPISQDADYDVVSVKPLASPASPTAEPASSPR